MLNLEKSKQERAFIKKLVNGFEIKSLNQFTGRENTIIIRAENRSLGNKCQSTLKYQPSMKPIIADKYQETTCSTSDEKLGKFTESIRKLMNRYLKTTDTIGISGFHVFMDDDSNTFQNIQTRSVIFVANKEIAREKGAQFTIPGKLINLFHVSSQGNECEFMANTIVKPVTLVVGDYTLHIDINFCHPGKITSRAVSTQTSNDCLSISLSKANMFNTNSKYHLTKSDIHKCTQTEVNEFESTTQMWIKEFPCELMSGGEFAQLFNPKSLTKGSYKEEREDTSIGFLLECCHLHGTSSISPDNCNLINMTKSNSENSFKTFKSHTDMTKYNVTSSQNSQDLINNKSVGVIKDKEKNSPGCICHNKLLSRKSKSVKTQKSASCISETSNWSEEYCMENPPALFSRKTSDSKNLSDTERKANSSCSDISMYEINRNLSNTVYSMNQLHSFVQMVDSFSQIPYPEQNKLCSSDDQFLIQNQWRKQSRGEETGDRTPSTDSLCDRCGSFFSVGKSFNHQCQISWANRPSDCSNGHIKPLDNTSCYSKRMSTLYETKNKDSAANTADKLCQSKSSKRITNINTNTSVDYERYNKSIKHQSNQQIEGIKPSSSTDISKSIEVIHYNENYFNYESTSTCTSSSIILRKENNNKPNKAEINDSEANILSKNDHNTLGAVKTINNFGSISEELANILPDKKVNSKCKSDAVKLNESQVPKGKVISWSGFKNSPLKLFSSKLVLSKSFPIHTRNIKEQKDNSKTLRFKNISGLFKTQFHRKSNLSSKTLHIVPSESNSDQETSFVENQTIELDSTVKLKEHVSSRIQKQSTVGLEQNNDERKLIDISVKSKKRMKWIFFKKY